MAVLGRFHCIHILNLYIPHTLNPVVPKNSSTQANFNLPIPDSQCPPHSQRSKNNITLRISGSMISHVILLHQYLNL